MKKTNLVILVLAFCVGLIPGIAKAKLVACVGDSITYGEGISNRASNCYPAQLENILRHYDPDWQTQNFGHSGTTLLRNKSASYVTKTAYSLALASEPDVVVIMLGTNDCARATSSEIEQRFISDYLALIDDFAQLPSQPKIFVCYPPPIFLDVFGYNNTVLTNQIIPRIEQLPTYRNVEIIDLYALLENSANLFSDGLHPNTEGARMIAETVASMILGFRGSPDLNGDKIVDIEDLIIMIAYWDQNELSCDLAPVPFGDGIVDRADLEVLMSHWGEDYSLMAHWKLDETEGDIALDSIGENDGTLHGEPLWLPEGGIVDGAIELDGIDDYIITPRALPLQPNVFSIFAWVKGGLPGQVILSQVNRSDWLAADTTDGSLMTELTFIGKTKQTLSSQAVITDGNWHRLGLVWDGTNRILYVDDIEVASDTYPSGSLIGDLQIGAGYKLESGTFWSGLIDDVRIYNRAITP